MVLSSFVRFPGSAERSGAKPRGSRTSSGAHGATSGGEGNSRGGGLQLLGSERLGASPRKFCTIRTLPGQKISYKNEHLYRKLCKSQFS